MNPLDLAKKYLYPYRIKGSEISPELCPYCNGGQHGDKYTFSMHIENGAYNCKRGKCAVTGSFNELLRYFGEQTKNYEIRQPQPSKFVAPKVTVTGLSEKSANYLESRGISKATWELLRVKESNGNLVFPYYENGKLVLVKYRKPEKYTGEGRKAWREKGGKAVFWGMDLVEGNENLLITEGEYDTAALYEAGVRNVVSVPSGAEDLTCVENCWEWLEKFKNICIWPDNDGPGQEMARKLIAKLGVYRCYVVQSDYKDANEALYKAGKEKVKELVRTAREVPIAGLIRLSEVEAYDVNKVTRVKSTINPINKATGGYLMGQLSIWTGDSGSGKSTYLGQELIESVEQGYRVCAYSGELPAALFRYWVDMQCAGPRYLYGEFDSYRQQDVKRVNPECVELIRQWYAPNFFLYDVSDEADENNLLEVFQHAARRYDCKVFLVDNLMMMVFSNSDSDFYRKQSTFTKKLKAFAKQHDCHVHLVAHPRKAQGRVTKQDVQGSKDITNIADNVFGVYRVRPEEREKEDCDTYIDIFKSRFSGRQDFTVPVMFCQDSKRFYARAEIPTLYRQYGWEKGLPNEGRRVLGGGKQ